MTDMGDRLKPGPGWVPGPKPPNEETAAVFHHTSGVTAHKLGCCRLASGRFIYPKWPESCALNAMIMANGGNRKRGILAWARDLQRSETGLV